MDTFKVSNNHVLYLDKSNSVYFSTYSLMTRFCPRYVRVMDLWEHLLRRNANRDGRGELFILGKAAKNLQEKHQGVKHRKSKEKDVCAPNNSSFLQVKIFYLTPILYFFQSYV